METNLVRAQVKVFVAYAWQKGVEDCKCDVYWKSIRDYFKGTNESLGAHGITVSFRRLRASHGRFIWSDILSKMKSADVLIFDIAKAPADASHQRVEFNSNVLLELGATLALPEKKQVLVLCPSELKSQLPSDLSGFLYSFYTEEWLGAEDKGVKRKFEDKWGILPQYRAMLMDAVEEKTGFEISEA